MHGHYICGGQAIGHHSNLNATGYRLCQGIGPFGGGHKIGRNDQYVVFNLGQKTTDIGQHPTLGLGAAQLIGRVEQHLGFAPIPAELLLLHVGYQLALQQALIIG